MHTNKLEGNELTRTFVGHAALGIAICIAICGCNGGPTPIRAPDWDPGGLADRVIAQLDSSGDGAVDKQEAIGAPSIVQAFVRIDKNGDGRLSGEELHDRFAFYKEYGTGLMNQGFGVRLDGRPAAVGSRVDLIPEPFLKDVIRRASGIVDGTGQVAPVAENAEFPGMQVGLYQAVLYVSKDSKNPLAGVAPIGVEVSPLGARDSSAKLDFNKK
jgi:hypothetical protein